jgi:hypothetical protein
VANYDNVHNKAWQIETLNHASGRWGNRNWTEGHAFVGLAGQTSVGEAFGIDDYDEWIEVNGRPDNDIKVTCRLHGRDGVVDAKTRKCDSEHHTQNLLVYEGKVTDDFYVAVGYPDLKIRGWQFACVVEGAPVLVISGIPTHEVPPHWLLDFERLLEIVKVRRGEYGRS